VLARTFRGWLTLWWWRGACEHAPYDFVPTPRVARDCLRFRPGIADRTRL